MSWAGLLVWHSFLRAEMRSVFADKTQTEGYFDLYRTHLGKIGTLDSESIRHVTACYTFLKASRDATIALERWDAEGYPDMMKKSV